MSTFTQMLHNRSIGRLARFRRAPISLPEAPPAGRRVLLLSASVGSGHARAAQAIEAGLSDMLPDASIAHVDALQLTNPVFRSLYCHGYFKAVARAPHLVAMMFDGLDRPCEGMPLRLMMERANFGRLIKFLTGTAWDLVVCTHFLPAGLCSWLKRSGRAQFPLATVVTDFDVHGLWINRPTDRYFVAGEDARATLVAAGVSPADVSMTGIPIDPVFASPKTRAHCRAKHGLDGDRRMILQMAGGFGLGPVEQIYRSLQDVPVPLQIVVVAGKNAAAAERLRQVKLHPRHRAVILGFTREVDELLTAADLIVSKPGGLTTSESLARGCPMVVVDPIPGQEDRNSDFLLENGCGIKVNNIGTLSQKLTGILADHDRLAAMRQSALRRGRPAAAYDVAAGCVRLLGSAARVASSGEAEGSATSLAARAS